MIKNNIVYMLNNISKIYEGRDVLSINQLSIQKGEIFCLVGPSGAGKSTLLRLLNFLEAPDQGEIKFLDQVYSQSKQPSLDIKRKVTTVFQRPALMTSSVVKNIAYPLKIRGEEVDYDQIDQLLIKLGLEDLKDQRADKLSGGEAQRVSLARALIFKPEVLLLDEPTSNLDPANIKIIEDIIIDYIKTNKTTIVMVTHNLFQAKRLADRVGLLHDGSFIEVKEKEGFFNNPEQELTKDYLAGRLIC
ncbi:ATP-binding cassette domain-containing protein [Natroniella acetigena]|uniref:ABC transporter ATP-binding protein n=1 Tax=Natroniella acetigena TaxID=52004 RepID=UPI00200A5CE9|nr:ATP-binding cassette domain-containing protein [Natroniella acetigena]MCK8827168.1 ATP-binding cassette domain-containing protein [Natroniella acetigena]